MPAIDYMQLLREEKRKRKSNKNNKQVQKKETATSEDDTINTNENGNGLTSTTDTPTNTKTQQQQSLPTWSCPPGHLAFRRLDLQVLSSDNPSTISYSSTVLDDTTTALLALEEWMANLPEDDIGLNSWKTMTYGKRRAAMFGEKYNDDEDDDDGESLPLPLSEIAMELIKCGIFSPDEPPNHVLCNDYQPSQGILPHTDGPLYSSRTATLSLKSDVVMSFTKRLSSNEIGEIKKNTNNNNNDDNDVPKNDKQEEQQDSPAALQVLLQAGSLLTFEGDAYSNYCHGIEMDVLQDVTTTNCLNATAGQIVPRERRFSLTFRHKPRPRPPSSS